MKIKIILILFLVFFYFENLNGQTNNIYIELLGVGLMGSVNYEKMLVPDKVFARVSFGYFDIVEKDTFDVFYGTDTYITEDKLSITPICLGANYMVGNKWRLELGGGIAYWIISYEGESELTGFGGLTEVSEGGNYINLYSTIGLRYQKPEGGITFKVGLSPTYAKIEEEKATFNFPHISIGYAW